MAAPTYGPQGPDPTKNLTNNMRISKEKPYIKYQNVYMHAKIIVNRKTTRNIFKYFLKSLENDAERPTYSGPFTPIYLHLKPTSRAALCEDFTMQVNSTKLGPAMSGPNSNRNL